MDHWNHKPIDPIGPTFNNSYITSYLSIFTTNQESVASVWDLHHDYTTSQLGLHDLLRDWRAEMQAYSREPGRYRYWSHSLVLYN